MTLTKTTPPHPAQKPIQFKEKFAGDLFRNRALVQSWFEKKFSEFPPSFYCSIDIRDSGDKVCPVDCNLFPAGFNNICEIDRKASPALFQDQISKLAKLNGIAVPEKIMIVPENHTENKFYLESLYDLKTILEDAGYEVSIARYFEEDCTEENPNPKPTFELTSASEKKITEHSMIRKGNKIQDSTGFIPDWIVLNNDFSQGYPKCLDGITQPIFPTFKLGWHSRKKSTHFEHYNRVAAELANLIGTDPWSITIHSNPVENVNFSEGTGMDRVISVADSLIKKISTEYQERGITRKPALFIKNDSGTYGMGIMVIESIEELTQMNRRTKNKMSVGKNKSIIDQVLIQEGVPTTLSVDGLTSEPVIYMMGQALIGGFIRSNSERNDMDNLNSQGMIFKKLCFKDLSDSLNVGKRSRDVPPLEAVYGTVAQLSALAAAMEIKETQTK